jgi:FkbM family methyltransferase
MIARIFNSTLVQLIRRWRVLVAARCHDCDVIPKVESAGQQFPGTTPYQLMHNGLKIIIGSYYGSTNWMHELIKRLKGHHEPQEERVFYEILPFMPDGAVMLELGSFWAYYSMWFQKAVSGARNYLIEPIESNLESGRANFSLNGMHGDFVQAAVGASSAEGIEFVDGSGGKVRINQLCVDDFLENKRISFLDLLHCDVQGAELDVLRGSQRSIAEHRVGYLLISTHEDKHPACLEWIRNAGYLVMAEHSVEESFSADGLIAARSPRVAGPDSIHLTRSFHIPLVSWCVRETRRMISAKVYRRPWRPC